MGAGPSLSCHGTMHVIHRDSFAAGGVAIDLCASVARETTLLLNLLSEISVLLAERVKAEFETSAHKPTKVSKQGFLTEAEDTL